MSEAIKPTPGEWTVEPIDGNCYEVMCDSGYYIATCHDGVRSESNAIANARLIAEAGTVFHNTGLSPVQLVEQRDELMAACKKLVEWEAREKDHAIGFMERINLCETAFQMMYAALAKCEGVKP